ncbi:putative cystathionine gamma-synthase [Saitoella complicata NRRL Y-17804]|uniref:cystathionine gamma-synthase n=1 Tax=Saitoella complicata (strain BCRC 22490 / CBS 7301 / JCM 7358 / NBRC 10748 / NRRL Y-17804) TaxID=698492 RepID=A0A0E9NEF2_SAICN|nr:putative cystathionine gamma-synthase [Saitoella complicata NRRL Y-17804]ODQ51451.1 putative cystathionine gamma-synthase [Saitoella complicata NRRL Y-17804]GAO48188.1 hypothetical protein G7K_2368-t1 [Saitoella complicata NRRL Y-17804]
MGAVFLEPPPTEVGAPIPANTPHAVSVTLPTWKANVAYEEGEEWVVGKMRNGYPRFFIDSRIQHLTKICLERFGNDGEKAMLYPSRRVAERSREFILAKTPADAPPLVRIVEFTRQCSPTEDDRTTAGPVRLFIVLFPAELYSIAKQFWQHTGDGVSSRMAEYFLHTDNLPSREITPLSAAESPLRADKFSKGPYRFKHYSRRNTAEISATVSSTTPALSSPTVEESQGEVQDGLSREHMLYVEERYGRNLNTSFAGQAKAAMRRRIAGALSENVDLDTALASTQSGEPQQHVRQRSANGLSESDVYLFPSGMSSIFNTHRVLLSTFQPRKSVSFGFPYTDTLKILQKWGPGCHFYGRGSSEELDELEKLLESGERILALFCELPSNPLLMSPDLIRLRALADKYDFFIVVDETIGNFVNVHVMPFADIVVSSLTKVFSGDSNVMGGSMVLNPAGRHYQELKDAVANDYEDIYWPEDAIFMERNSRDYLSRIKRINYNAEALADMVVKHPKVKQVHYPKYSTSRANYDAVKNPEGGYGGLMSITFHTIADAQVFYDALHTAKGPSLGTNFTLSSPYTLLAHYLELEWAAQYGVDAALVRVSVGLEPTDLLLQNFANALNAAL